MAEDPGVGPVAATEPTDLVRAAATDSLDAPDVPHRQLGTSLLGLPAHACPANLDMLRERMAADPSWEVHEVLAQAFDAYRAAVGDDAAWPSTDAWLTDPHPTVRRAVSDGPRQ